MARYIDADTLIDKIKAKATEMFTVDSVYEYYIDALIDVENIIKEEPTADVVERKRGEWKVCDILDYAQRPTGRKILRCPFCEYLSDEFMPRVDYYRALTNFCPNCGARMTKE